MLYNDIGGLHVKSDSRFTMPACAGDYCIERCRLS